MNETLAHLTGHRSWWVLDVAVWGDAGAESVEMIASEIAGASRRVQFFRVVLGGAEQELFYSQMVDHRANPLPATINRPLVVLIPKSVTPVILLGEPSSTSLKVARAQSAGERAMVDLWIVEMGN